MYLTRNWVKKQISDYEIMLTRVNENDETDLKLKRTWSTTLNTLKSVLDVIEIEINHYNKKG